MSNFDFTSQICTTKEQSERLLALGLKNETADCCWEYKPKHLADTNYDWVVTTHSPIGTDIPAWSRHKLLEMLPTKLEYYGVELVVTKHSAYYQNWYWGPDGEPRWICIGNGKAGTSDNIYEHIVSVIEWLINKGYFNKEYLEE